MSRPKLDPRTPLTELHVHLGAAVTPAIMWGIAHSQGIRLPTKDYWAFRDLITVGRRRRSFQAYLDLFHWTELIQSSPTAVERSVYEVIGGAYRKNNVTRLELRFNPMKRNRGGEQDLDHIIAAAVRGMDRAVLEYPQVRAGLIFCLDRAFSYELNEIIAAKAICFHEALQPSFADYARQIVANAQTLAETLLSGGLTLSSGGTDNHLLLCDVTALAGLTGKIAETALDRAGITVNKNMIPYDRRKPLDPSGIRLGTPALTTRGMKEPEMRRVGQWILTILRAPDDTALAAKVKGEIAEFAKDFPVPGIS